MEKWLRGDQYHHILERFPGSRGYVRTDEEAGISPHERLEFHVLAARQDAEYPGDQQAVHCEIGG